MKLETPIGWAGRMGTPLPSPSIRRVVLGVAASLAAIAVTARLLDGEQIRAALGTLAREPGLVLMLAVAYLLAFCLRAAAWRLLLTTPVSTGRLVSILHVSLFVNHLLPLKAGEIARPYLATRRGVPGAEAAASTAVARLLDLGSLACIASVLLFTLGRSRELGIALLWAGGVIMCAGVALVVFALRTPRLLPGRVRAPWQQVQDALRTINRRRIIVAIPLVLASWVLEGAVLLGAAYALDVGLSVQAAVGATAFTILFQVVQFTPGGLGVYEVSMTSVLVVQGVSPGSALALAVITHGLKFVYSFTIGLGFTAIESFALVRRGPRHGPRHASRFEIVMARLWNVVNEGKPFTPVFSLAIILALSAPHAADPGYWLRLAGVLLLLAPMFIVLWRYDFPLKLRAGLWCALAAFVAIFRFVPLVPVLVVVAAYLTFTVIIWGTVYYHLRIGMPWTNFLRFWRLVAENPDPTSGNLQEQIPKVLLLVLSTQYLIGATSWQAIAGIELFTLALGIGALLLHQWFFTWVPPLPQPLGQGNTASGERISSGVTAPHLPTPISQPPEAAPSERISSRVIVIAIDGCRADRLAEAHTPFIDSLIRGGTQYTNVATVYPARTVTCFSSMLTGAPARVHGMRSNFVPSLGVKCESVFDVLEREGKIGRIAGIAHLIDAFGEERVRSVTAVTHNDAIDDALVERAKLVMQQENPELLVLQLLSVDQTGHARGSYNAEYLAKIEATDRIIEGFVSWCREHGFLDDATLIITSDHGQGIGIGGHGHMTPPEIRIPCILWGKGVEAGHHSDEQRFITDIASTICHALGVPEPAASVGRTLLPVTAQAPDCPLAFIIPAYNEQENLARLLPSIARSAPPDAVTIVVDDGSVDHTSAVAEALGAVVVRHPRNRGLGAALRTGILHARMRGARIAVYLDADLEYDPSDAWRLIAPIERGEADYVLGSRFRGRVDGMTLSRRCANRAFSLLLSLLCGRWISDGQTGFRAFSRRALEVAEIVHDYNYAQVLTLDLLHKGMRMQEVPISYRRRQHGRSFITARYLWRVPAGMAREVLTD